MAAQYTETSLEDFTQLLNADKGWVLDQSGKEYVFKFRVVSQPRLLIKVYSGVRRDTGAGRGRGQDAIRVCCVLTDTLNTEEGRGWIAAPSVHRTQNWRDNLRQRVTDVIMDAKERLSKQPKGAQG